jgi:hypothetical protein
MYVVNAISSGSSSSAVHSIAEYGLRPPNAGDTNFADGATLKTGTLSTPSGIVSVLPSASTADDSAAACTKSRATAVGIRSW